MARIQRREVAWLSHSFNSSQRNLQFQCRTFHTKVKRRHRFGNSTAWRLGSRWCARTGGWLEVWALWLSPAVRALQAPCIHLADKKT
ncbi:hypothetical protein COCVIDRAFT_84812 [Bipolaris victoriae FI3]|uniref:Uncharacterized protein n=1 Tax=Bipolaris victoriae (strain FI3) TaxID=930091 RepID=W7EX17_BIPV3|nr:hypothetical protein COCVIDRAFT_84812 [Bipolaris victoriae FI3]